MVDRDRGVVRIGISRAMELVTAELAAGKVPSEVQGPALPTAGSTAACRRHRLPPTRGCRTPVGRTPNRNRPFRSIVPHLRRRRLPTRRRGASPPETSPVEEKK